MKTMNKAKTLEIVRDLILSPLYFMYDTKTRLEIVKSLLDEI